jgi:hypothetical protein
VLWYLEGDDYSENCGMRLPSWNPSTHPVGALCFSPNPELSLLTIAYLDENLVLFDPFRND